MKKHGMNNNKQYWSLLLPVAILLFCLPGSRQPQRLENQELQAAFVSVASDSLKTEYKVLVTGDLPELELVPQRDGSTHSYRDGKERIATALRVRDALAKAGMSFSNIDMTLTPTGVDKIGEKVILHAIEETAEHFTYLPPSNDSRPQVTESRINHDFVFSVTAVADCQGISPYGVCLSGERYLLIEDIVEPRLIRPADGSPTKHR